MRRETMSDDWEIDPSVRAEVRRIYLEWMGLPDLSEIEQTAVIDAEAARLTGLVNEALGDSAHGYQLQRWRQEHPGQTPDHETVVSLMQTERHTARQKVLEEELYPQLTEEILEQRQLENEKLSELTEQRISDRRAAKDPERWRTGLVAPSELAEQIVARLWGLGRTMPFLELAVSLVAQRLEDGLPIPVTTLDPLFDELDQIVTAEADRDPAAF